MYRENERLEIAQAEYENYSLNDPVNINNNTINIGYVSEIKNKLSGENTYIIADVKLSKNPTVEELSKVKTVTVLYQGSTADIVNKPAETILDWVVNDIPMAARILVPDFIPTRPTIQLRDASDTLQDVLKRYPNAQIDIYAHSLGLMNASGALADVESEDSHRIRGAYLFNGPNIYKTLNNEQRQNMGHLKDRIHIYIDTNDFIGLGYDTPNVIGNVYRIQTNSKGLLGIVDQHMWGGYQTDEYGNFIHADGSLVSSDIRLRHIDIDNDGVVDVKLDDFDVRTRNLVSKDLSLATSSQKIQVNVELLNALSQNLKNAIQFDMSEMKKIIELCIRKNETVVGDFSARKEKITESIKDLFKRSGMSHLLYDFYDSVGNIVSNRRLLEESVQPSKLHSYYFDSSQVPIVNGMKLRFSFYNQQLYLLQQSCHPLLERVNKEKTGNMFSFIFGDTPTVLKSWEIIENETELLLKSSDDIFEGEGLREGKKDGISESLSLVLDVILKNTEEIWATLNNAEQLVNGLAISFENADNWVGQQLENGNFSNTFRHGVIPSSYKAYLERDEVFDDVKDVLQAFDRQIETRSSEYARKVTTVYQDALGKFEEGLKDWLSFGEELKKNLTAVMDNYATSVYVKQRKVTYEHVGDDVVEKESFPITYWGMLLQLYPYHTRQVIEQLKFRIVPTFDKIQQALWRSQNTKNQLSNLEAQLKPIIEDGVYHAFDLDEIVKGQKRVSSIATRLGKEIQHVIDVIDGDGMQAQAITTLKQKLSETRQLIDFYTQFVDDCFGDNENSGYVSQSGGGDKNMIFSLN